MIPRRVCILTMDSIWISFFFCFSCEKPASRLLPSFLSFFCFLPWKRCQKRAQEIIKRERERGRVNTRKQNKNWNFSITRRRWGGAFVLLLLLFMYCLLLLLLLLFSALVVGSAHLLLLLLLLALQKWNLSSSLSFMLFYTLRDGGDGDGDGPKNAK